ncbi:MAG: sel1 repeat family protein [Parachlamydiaceae bacterium]|nr:sel1 repeat family protein [Parachlamydiaceae bacterium]
MDTADHESKSSQRPHSIHKAFLALKDQADNGSADAQFQIGCFYEDWKNIQHSYELAFHYYKLAADQGHPNAQTCLAMLFDDGLGVKQDSEQAFHYYILASEQKWPSAVAQLGKFYEEGKGGSEKSPKEAIRHYQMAAEMGALVAWRYLAEAYQRGIGVDKSEEKVRFCQRKTFLLKKKKQIEGIQIFRPPLDGFLKKEKGLKNQ